MIKNLLNCYLIIMGRYNLFSSLRVQKVQRHNDIMLVKSSKIS